jgi:hypothetical protein
MTPRTPIRADLDGRRAISAAYARPANASCKIDTSLVSPLGRLAPRIAADPPRPGSWLTAHGINWDPEDTP